MEHSRIFAPSRALGYVSNEIPLVTRYIIRRKEHYIVTCVGRQFHTYGLKHFTLLSVSGTHPEDITCLAADTFHVYTASGNKIYAWRRGTELKHTYTGHDCKIIILLPFGAHLLSVDDSSTLKAWDIKDESLQLELNFSNDIFRITTMVHPNTYLNKILLGSSQGEMQLWNIKHMKRIYTFEGWKVAITAMEQAPAIDVVAVGLYDGRIILHNLKYDETIFQLRGNSLVVSISFRTDGCPIMATSTSCGLIVLWNLEQRKMEHQMQPHSLSAYGLKYVPNEPLLLTSSADNTLKLWIFDTADGSGRLLRIREGHSMPPTQVRFYGNDGNYLLTSGGDSSFRMFSTVTEILNKSLGKASFNRKAAKKRRSGVVDPLQIPEITNFAAEVTREKEWCNVVATHSNLGTVTTWSTHQQKMGDIKLVSKELERICTLKLKYFTATSLFITRCGNFVVIGYSSGNVERFNIQSGIRRASYGDHKGRAHNDEVTGVMVDNLNQAVITASRDLRIKFWDFKVTKDVTAKTTLILHDAVEWIRYHNESSLIAIALENFEVVLLDIDTRRIVRCFEGHKQRVTDACFNPDARWLITASMDCMIRVWDIPSSHLIDIFEVPDVCISLCFSPTGEFLATAHDFNNGIFLWSNRMLYSHVSLKAINFCPSEAIPKMKFPNSSIKAVETDEIIAAEPDYISADQLDSDLITMSAVAQSRWQNLLDIDIVKRRNKPKQALKIPETAPFFLPTIPSLQLQFDFSNVKSDNAETSRVHPTLENLTSFGKSLQSTAATDDFPNVVEKLKTMGPSAIDFEIQSLSLDESSSELSMLQFMKMIHYMMKRQTDFELSQAYLAVFLKWHGVTISENRTLRDYLQKIQEAQTKNWLTLREKLFYNISVVQNLKKM